MSDLFTPLQLPADLHLRERIALSPTSGAWLSDEDTPLHRYALWRIWERSSAPLLVSMLNPSTAGHTVDDPTIKRVIGFARRDGFGGILVLNAYAFRSSTPERLWRAPDPDGPLNRLAKRQAVEVALAVGVDQPVALMAHGNHGGEGARKTFDILHSAGCRIVCLGRTLAGHPKHPLARGVHRIPNDAPFLDWSPSGAI